MGQAGNEHQHFLDPQHAAYDQKYDFLLYLMHQYDRDLLQHSINTAEIAFALGMLNNTDLESNKSMYWGALLHDIGKMCLPKTLFSKLGALSDEEKQCIRQHPRRGLLLVQYYGIDDILIQRIIIGHHEYKPYSYPRTGSERRTDEHRDQSTRRDSIAEIRNSEFVKMVAIADAYEALQSDSRPYKSKLARSTIQKILREDFEKNGMEKYREQVLSII